MKAIVTTLLAAGFAAACSSAGSPRTGRPPEVDAALGRAELTSLSSDFEAGGVLRARLTTPVASQVLAPIIDVRVRPGDRVRRGAPLVILDGRELRARADGASAALAAARQGLSAAESERSSATAALALATAVHDRMSGLHTKRSATNQELDEAIAALRAAEARLAGADARAAEAAASITAAEAAANASTIGASYSTLSAPFDGLVTERLADPGSIAAPGSPLLTLEDTAAFRLDVRLDESRARGITVGQEARVHLDDESSDVWRTGRVSEVSRIDAASHAFVVKVEVAQSATLRSGAFGRARFPAAPIRALAAPQSALARRGQLTFVFALDADGLARLTPVRTGRTAGDRVEVVAGLSDGDRLVLNPPPSLADGTRVKNAAPGGQTPAGGRQ